MQIKKGYENITSDRTGYYLDGIKYPRVSAFLKNLDKRFLINWAVKLACNRIDELLEPHLDLTNKRFDFHFNVKTNIIEKGKNEHILQVEEAQEYGSFVHDKIECWLKKCDEPKKKCPADWIEPANKSLQSFIDFWQKGNFELIKSEMAVINKELKYGGRVDILARKGDDIILLDVKTGKSIGDGKIQCGLYAMALEEMLYWVYRKSTTSGKYDAPCGKFENENFISKAIILHIPKLNPKVKPIEVIDDEFEYAKKAGLDLVSLYYNLKGVK